MRLKKIITSLVIVLVFFSSLKVEASFFTKEDKNKSEIEQAIEKDEGGLFEKIIAKVIGGLAETVLDLSTNETLGIGFKNYDELIFAKDTTDIAPFSIENWNLTVMWYWRIVAIIGIPILIAIIILAYKLMIGAFYVEKRVDAKDSIMRLIFGAIAIAAAPFFVKFLLFINNNMVRLLIIQADTNLNELLGNSIISQIRTGNVIATALVIALFAYLFAVVNIRFIIRQFTIIVFTIFTPIVSVFWIINKRTIASAIWFGQIFINVFMQFIYAFLFLIYIDFLPKAGGWATSILWAMMILPLADSLQNTMQNLISRVAGINNGEMAMRGIGVGAAMGHTIKAIAYQFKSNDMNEKEETNMISRIVDRNSNVTNSRELEGSNYEIHSRNIFNDNPKESQQENGKKTNSIAKKIYNVGKESLNFGMYMAEGKNFKTTNYGQKNNNIKDSRNKHKNGLKEQSNKIIIKEIKDEEF